MDGFIIAASCVLLWLLQNYRYSEIRVTRVRRVVFHNVQVMKMERSHSRRGQEGVPLQRGNSVLLFPQTTQWKSTSALQELVSFLSYISQKPLSWTGGLASTLEPSHGSMTWSNSFAPDVRAHQFHRWSGASLASLKNSGCPHTPCPIF